MDQVKEYLRVAIKFRFWIAVGVSALLPLIAYFVGVGPVRAKAEAETGKIKQADEAVKKFLTPGLANAQYKTIVDGKTETLTGDVDASWRKLYNRQAPLLTWPERVKDRFHVWGRTWPKDVDASAVRVAIIDYVNVYPEFVTKVYKSFRPFDPENGEGVVSAPPEAALLQPSQFSEQDPPDLGKVWASQERLWVQRTLLDVIESVNKGAKGWDDAVIKQVNSLVVGNPLAQDQRSISKGEALEEAPAILDPDKPVEAEPAAGDSASSGAGGPVGAAYGGLGMARGGMGGGPATKAESVYYIHTDSTQFKVLPVQMSVLIEQNRIQDLLVALENSPMTVQVMDFEMAKPGAHVVKPVVGQSMSFMGGMGGVGYGGSGGMMGAGYGGAGPMMGGYGGAASRMAMNSAGYGGAGQMMAGMGGMGGGAPARKGVDKRSENLSNKAAEQETAVKKSGGRSLNDPYYNIVEVKIYGQARFFNPPPAEAPPEPSQAPAEAAATAEAKPETPAATPDAGKKPEEPKADAPKADAPKAEEPKAEAPKPEAPKIDAPKADAPKVEAPKADVPKPDVPKVEAEKKADAPAPK